MTVIVIESELLKRYEQNRKISKGKIRKSKGRKKEEKNGKKKKKKK